MLKILFALVFYLSISSTYADDKLIIQLINQRMGLMKDIAANKALHHQAIEDLEQEQKVLAASLTQASQLGIDPQSIEPFIHAQMDVAKAIQYRYRADWLSSPEPNWQARDLSSVRQKISQLSSDLIDNIAQELYKKERLELSANHLKESSILTHPHVSLADQRRLLDTLAIIQLEHSQSPSQHRD